MGIFTKRFDRAYELAQPIQPAQVASPWQDNDVLTQLTWSELFGYEHMPIDRSAAVKIGTIARGRDLICAQSARFPLRVVNRAGQIVRSPLSQQLEVGRPLTTTLTWIFDGLLFYSRAYLRIVQRYNDAYPMIFEFIPEWRAKTDAGGMLLAVDDEKIDRRDWIRIDAPHEGYLARAVDDIRDAIALKKAVGNAAKNPVPSVELHQRGGNAMTRDEIDALVQSWIDARSRHGVGYTNANVELKTHGQAPEQLMINGRNQTAIELARHMNLPAWAVDAVVEGGSMTYTNVPSRSRELLDYTLQPYLDAVAGRLSLGDVTPHGQAVQFDTSQFLAGNFGERMTAYKTAIDAGIYTPEEVRQIEAGTNPLGGIQ